MFALDAMKIAHNQRRQRTECMVVKSDGCCDDADERSSTFKANHKVSSEQHSLTSMRVDAFFDRYDVVEKIGHGSMGIISIVRIKADKIGGSAYECKCKGFFGYGTGRKKILISSTDRPKVSSSYQYALKTLQTNCNTKNYVEELCNEIKIIKSCDHPNIIKALEVYDTKKKGDQVYLVLELCTGGDLYTRSPYSRREAAQINSKILSAIKYMHYHNIVHRDIKYENILFETEESTADIKIIDFGLSKRLANHMHPENMCERVGTTYTMAPEMLRRGYSSKADMWSIGVVAYMVCI
jgi:serine/threonine protein kinase